MVKFCLPILKSTARQIQDVIERHKDDFDIFEIWLDYLRSGHREFIENLPRLLADNRSIFLFRRQNLETIRLSFEERCELMKVLTHGSYLDLDMLTQGDELAAFEKTACQAQLILSYHNYKYTPELEELRELVSRMAQRGAVVCKIATLCRSERDALRLMELLLECRERGQRCIILGMGEHGRVTRVIGSLWGNEVIFAPVKSSDSSAPQQLTRRQLDRILKELV